MSSNSSARPAGSSHWPEYLGEGAGLGLFMISANGFAALLEHPASPVHQLLPDPVVRRMLMGVAMGLTAIALIYSPWGRRSGAHFNPAVTLTFFHLGKVARRDLLGYLAAQFIGGAVGAILAGRLLGSVLAHPRIRFVVTQPGTLGASVAFAAEFVLTFLLMSVVLTLSNMPRLARFTGLCAGLCIALFITFEAPLSGMSLNPARSFASALAANDATALWIYFVAPPLGMFAAATVRRRQRGPASVRCAKLQHPDHVRCIFCEYQAARLRDALQR
jgi:aquaporin Z